MFILTDIATGGVYAVSNAMNQKTVHIFEEEDDAVRYVEMLKADDYEDELEIMKIDATIVAMNCDKYGYHYSVVKKDDLIVPP
jgi:hypothetical protein|tara:strand:- start:330 stop:578 length:249 start_codon:yes stop_codon:yes gene_type:complete